MEKHYLTASTLLDHSVSLALDVLDDDYRPDLLVGVWRGGSPIAIAMHETFRACGHYLQHTVLRASSYTGTEQQEEVSLVGIDELVSEFPEAKQLLIVDDVFDTGLTMQAIVGALRARLGVTVNIRIATPYYKPGRNLTSLEPDYFRTTATAWLVFPHELCGLGANELAVFKTDLHPATRSRLCGSIKGA